MKILELALLAFGPFTDVVLDLSGGQEGLHLVLRTQRREQVGRRRGGYGRPLFEIPAQSADDFLHPYAKIRVSLTLRGGDGRTLRFLRRKWGPPSWSSTVLPLPGRSPLRRDRAVKTREVRSLSADPPRCPYAGSNRQPGGYGVVSGVSSRVLLSYMVRRVTGPSHGQLKAHDEGCLPGHRSNACVPRIPNAPMPAPVAAKSLDFRGGGG